jgi:hypothetical protein
VEKDTGAKHNYTDFIRLLFNPDDVFGIFIKYDNKFKNIYGGYFNLNTEEKIKQLEKIINQHDGQAAIYVTLNPLHPSVLGAANNKITKDEGKPSDKDVLYYRHFYIDVDPDRKSGICSTNEQHKLSLKSVSLIKDYLTSNGWPEPLIQGDSGNGSNLIYRVPNLTTNKETSELFKKILENINNKFGNKELHIDLKVIDPSRITRILGTVNVKGEEVPELTIFHRRSSIITSNKNTIAVNIELLNALVDKEKPSKEKTNKKSKSEEIQPKLDVRAYLEHYKQECTGEKEKEDYTMYLLKECIFDSSHKGKDSFIGQSKDGKLLFYKCFHDSCDGRTWNEAREKISGEDKLTQFYPEGSFKTFKTKDELYEFTPDNGLRRWKNGKKAGEEGNYFPISNFLATITKEIIHHNGINTEKFLEIDIEGYKNKIHYKDILTIKASEFDGLKWVTNNYAPWAIIEPEMNKYVKHAIQYCSNGVQRETVYIHTGWVHDKDGYFYLTSNGAIGRDNIKVDFKNHVPEIYSLPITPEEEKEALKASFELTQIGKEDIVYPLWVYIYLSSLTTIISPIPNFILYLYGKTGTFKTELSHLALSHFGEYSKFKQGFGDCGFSDTEAAIQARGFYLKDTLLLLDDYCPTKKQNISDSMNKILHKMIRIYSNRNSRKRQNVDMSNKITFDPRGMLIITGEDSTEIESSVARLLELDIKRSDIDIKKLSLLQKKAHLFPHAMSSFINYLIPRIQSSDKVFEKRFEEIRGDLIKNCTEDIHKRHIEQGAFLITMSEILMNFMQNKGILTKKDGEFFCDVISKIFNLSRKREFQTLKEMSEIDIFFDTVKTMIEQGKIYLFNIEDGTCTSSYVVNGRVLEIKSEYRYVGKDKDYMRLYNKNNVDYDTFKNIPEQYQKDFYIYIPEQSDPRLKGEFVGWYDDDNYYFISKAILTSVYDYFKKSGNIFPVSERTLKKRLKEEGWLIINSSSEENLSKVIIINGKSRRVLAIKKKEHDKEVKITNDSKKS